MINDEEVIRLKDIIRRLAVEEHPSQNIHDLPLILPALLLQDNREIRPRTERSELAGLD